jgi:hypothetical protein
MRVRWIIPVLLVIVVAAAITYGRRHRVQPVQEAAEQPAPDGAATPQRPDPGGRPATPADLSQAKKLTIDNPYGNVEVRTGEPPYSLVAVMRVGDERVEDWAETDSPFTFTQEMTDEGEYKATVKADSGHPEFMNADLDVVAEVPAALEVSVRVKEGDASVANLQAKARVNGQAGKVTVRDCSGGAEVSTTVGDVEVTNVKGGVTANASSGDVFLERVEGDAVARAMGGMVTARITSSDKVAATTMSGDLDVRVSSPFSGNMEVRSMDGDIAVAIPARSNCRVRTATNTGAISCTLPLRQVERAGPNVSGQLGAGEGRVEVTNNSGDIRVGATK